MFEGLTIQNYTKLNEVMSSHLLCLACNQTLTTKALVMKHVQYHEGVTLAYLCKMCQTVMRTKEDLEKHYDSQVEKKDICGVCQKQFSCKRNLKRHAIMTHTVARPYCCTVCCKNFTKKEQLFEHQKEHKKKGLVRIICTETLSCTSTSILGTPSLGTISRCKSGEPAKKMKMLAIFHCEQCDQPFTDENSLQEHVVNTHSTTGPVGRNVVKAYGKLPDSSSTEPVSIEANPAAPSAMCNQIADVINSNASIGPNHCNMCDRKFSSINCLQRHNRDVHSFRGSFTCKDCQYTFTLKSLFIDHFVDRNVGCCPVCSKSFPKLTSKCMFDVHVRSHEKKIEISSPVCRKQFISNAYDADCSEHILEDISATMKKLYCKLCNKDFLTEVISNKHMALHNSSDTVICNKCSATFTVLDRYSGTEFDKNGIVSCTSCSEVYDSPNDLVHQQVNPNGRKSTMCCLCFNGFSSLYKLQDHYQLQHDSRSKISSLPDPIVKCKLCWSPWTYLKLSQLRYHIALHTGEPSALRAIAAQSPTLCTSYGETSMCSIHGTLTGYCTSV